MDRDLSRVALMQPDIFLTLKSVETILSESSCLILILIQTCFQHKEILTFLFE